jgi:hypothetical protein
MLRAIKKLIFKLQHYDELLRLNDQLTDLIWDNASFRDSQGRTDSDRNVSETQAHWDNYHKITQRINQLKI